MKNKVTALSLQVGETQLQRHFVWYWEGDVSQAKVQYAIKEDYELAGGFTSVNSTVEFGSTEVIYENPKYTSCKVRISGLMPGNLYVYRVGTEQGYDENVYEFQTQKDVNQKQVFNIIGDLHMKIRNFQSVNEMIPQDRIARWQGLLEKMLRKEPDLAFILSAGDNISSYNMGIGDVTALRKCGENEHRMLFEAPLMKSIPFASVLGNHEASEEMATCDAGVTSYHFDMPNDDGVSGHYENHSIGNFWFRSGSVLVIGIHAFKDWGKTRKNCSPEINRAYIENACRANQDAIWRIIVNHVPVYSYVAGEEENRLMYDYFEGLLEGFDIDAVFSAHAHAFSRSKHILHGKVVSEERVVVERNDKGYQTAYVENPYGTVYFNVPSAMDHSFSKVCKNYHHYLNAWGLQEESLISVDGFDGIAYASPMFVNIAVYMTGDRATMTVKTIRSDKMEFIDSYTIYK